jgi:hypothetical protein
MENREIFKKIGHFIGFAIPTAFIYFIFVVLGSTLGPCTNPPFMDSVASAEGFILYIIAGLFLAFLASYSKITRQIAYGILILFLVLSFFVMKANPGQCIDMNPIVDVTPF